MERLLILMDAANLYFTLNKKYNGRLDYIKFLDNFRKQGYHIHRALAYGGLCEESMSFVNFLVGAGYENKFKVIKEFDNGVRKANCDVDIAIDAIRILRNVDIVILGSADGDFAPLVQYIQALGKRVFIYACDISKQLREIADKYVELSLQDIDTGER